MSSAAAAPPAPSLQNVLRYEDTVDGIEASRLRDGQTIVSRGYHAVGDGGGNEYTFYSGSAPQPVDDIFWIGLSGGYLQANNLNAITLRQCGLYLDWRDEGTEANKVFASLNSRKLQRCDLEGDLGTSIPLIFQNSDMANIRETNWNCNLEVRATAAITANPVLSLLDHVVANFQGNLTVRGTGSITYASRTCKDLLRVNNCQGCTFDQFAIERCYDIGLNIEVPSASGTNNNGCIFNSVRPRDCGSWYSTDSGYGVAANWSAPTREGSSASSAQWTELTVDVPPPPGTTHVWFSEDGSPNGFVSGSIYQIRPEMNGAGKVFIYPWLQDDLYQNGAGSGTIRYLSGAGVRFFGYDSNEITIKKIYGVRCGTLLRTSSAYGPEIPSLTSQFNGIGWCIGESEPTTGSFTGVHNNTQIGEAYFEADACQVFYHESGPKNLRISPHTYDLWKWIRNSPYTTGSGYNPVSQVFEGVRIEDAKGIHYYYGSHGEGATQSVQELWAGSPYRVAMFRNTQTLQLKADPDMRRLFGHDTVDVFCYGTGPNGEPVNPVKFTLDPAHPERTMMGGQDYSLELTRSCTLRCVLDLDDDWKIFPVEDKQTKRVTGPTNDLNDFVLHPGNVGDPWTQGSPGISVTEGNTFMTLQNVPILPGVRYDLEFDVTKSAGLNLGIILYGSVPGTGSGGYPVYLELQPDNTVPLSNNEANGYVLGDGHFHAHIRVIDTAQASYRLKWNRLQTHVGTHDLENIKLTQLDNSPEQSFYTVDGALSTDRTVTIRDKKLNMVADRASLIVDGAVATTHVQGDIVQIGNISAARMFIDDNVSFAPAIDGVVLMNPKTDPATEVPTPPGSAMAFDVTRDKMMLGKSTGWVDFVTSDAPAQATVYTQDGQLTGNRLIDTDGNAFYINDVTGGTFSIQCEVGGSIIINSSAGIQMASGGSLLQVGSSVLLSVSGNLLLSGLPTADPVVADAIWNDAGTLKISAG